MRSAQRWWLVAGGLVLAAVLFVVLKPGAGGPIAGAPEHPAARTGKSANSHLQAVRAIRVSGGQPVGGVSTISVHKGEPVLLVVTSDVRDEVHVHGYDLHKDVSPGGTVRFAFRATIDGVFEIELEKRATQIASLQVQP